MDKIKFGDKVKATRTFNGEQIVGEFMGYTLYDKENPNSVVGVVHVPGERPYDVYVSSISLAQPELTEFEKNLVEFFNNRMDLECAKDGIYRRDDVYNQLHSYSQRLMAIAKKEFMDKLHKFVENNVDWIDGSIRVFMETVNDYMTKN